MILPGVSSRQIKLAGCCNNYSMTTETTVELSISSSALAAIFADCDASVGAWFGHRRTVMRSQISDASEDTSTFHYIVSATLAVPLDQDMSTILRSKHFSTDFVPVGLFRVTRGAQAPSLTARDRSLIGQFLAAVEPSRDESELLFVYSKFKLATLEGRLQKLVSALVFDKDGSMTTQKIGVPNLGAKNRTLALSDYLVDDAADAIINGLRSVDVLDTRSAEEEHEKLLKILETEIVQLELAEERLRSMKQRVASQALTKKSFAKLSEQETVEMNAWIDRDPSAMLDGHRRNLNYTMASQILSSIVSRCINGDNV